VITCYELANIAYFAVLPVEIVRNSSTVAMQLGLRTMGAFGGYFMAAMVVCSTFGAINGNMWAASRLVVANAEEGTVFPKALGRIHPKRQSPVRAWILVAIMSMLLTLPGDFTYLASIYAFLLWVFYFLTVVALLILRRTMADSPRPFKIWWPLACLFLVVAGYLVVAPLIGTASSAGVYIGCIGACLIGVPIWYFRVRNPELTKRIASRIGFRRRGSATATTPVVTN
jgi:amino acid transporter